VSERREEEGRINEIMPSCANNKIKLDNYTHTHTHIERVYIVYIVLVFS
jgi:hypothetical protein